MSRAHPGESENYKHKKNTRESRTFKRNLLRRSQEEYRIRFGKPNISLREMERKKIVFIMKDL